MVKVYMKLEVGGIFVVIEIFEYVLIFNVIIIEIFGECESLLISLDWLVEYCDVGIWVIVIGDVNDVILYCELIS